MRLADKVAVVTGASKAFGRAIAIGYAREGADLALVDEAGSDLSSLANEIKDSGVRVGAFAGDLTRKSSVERLGEQIIADMGHVDVLVNATGRSHNQEFFGFPEDDFQDCLTIGLTSYFLTCQVVGKHMAERGSGSIINITSIIGRIGSGQAVGWSAARGGVDAMTRSLAQALGYYGVRVNGLAQGGQNDGHYVEEAAAERLRRVPLGRLGESKDFVGPAIFLASDESAYMTGGILYADGGYVTAAVTDDRFRPTWARGTPVGRQRSWPGR